MRWLFVLLIILPCLLSGSESWARPHHRSAGQAQQTFPDMGWGWGGNSLAAQPVSAAAGRAQASILPHPSGCPRRAFCGCGAALEVFGKPLRELWAAASWFRFPPASPAPGMVAVRRHHVFVIKAVLSGNQVLAYDANSGGGRTRLHVRSLAGYSVRNPRA